MLIITIQKLKDAHCNPKAIKLIAECFGKTDVDDNHHHQIGLDLIVDQVGVFAAIECLKVFADGSDESIRLLTCDLVTPFLTCHVEPDVNRTIKRVKKYARGGVTLNNLNAYNKMVREKLDLLSPLKHETVSLEFDLWFGIFLLTKRFFTVDDAHECLACVDRYHFDGVDTGELNPHKIALSKRRKEEFTKWLGSVWCPCDNAIFLKS